MNKIKNIINDDIFIEVCKTSLTRLEAAKKIGISYNTLIRYAKILNCELPKNKSCYIYNIDEILCENSSYSTNKLKKRLIKEKIKENKCEVCNITEWNGKLITLEIHHIDGNSSNNRLENLQLLCPNCHSQTSNFRGKKKKIENIKNINNIDFSKKIIVKKEKIKVEKIKILNNCLYCGKETKRDKFCSYSCYNEYITKNNPTKEQLIEDFKLLNSYSQVGKKYNVVDNAVRKWIIKYNILDVIEEIQINNKKDKYPSKEKIEEFLLKFKSLTKTSSELHIGKNNLKKLIIEYNIKL